MSEKFKLIQTILNHPVTPWAYISRNFESINGAVAHLFPAVAVVSLQMPFDDSVWRSGLTLQEGAASLHPILHHLQSVPIGCRAERDRDFHGNQNSHYHELLRTKNLSCGKKIKVLQATQLSQITIKLSVIRSLKPHNNGNLEPFGNKEAFHYFQLSEFINEETEVIKAEKTTMEVEDCVSYRWSWTPCTGGWGSRTWRPASGYV